MAAILLSWVGTNDMQASEESDAAETGPVMRAVEDREYTRVHLLHAYEDDVRLARVERYFDWFRGRSDVPLEVHPCSLVSPVDFRSIFGQVTGVLDHLEEVEDAVDWVYHLSPGTPAMTAVWVLLGKTRYPGTFIQTSREQGVFPAEIPFDIAMDVIPSLLRGPDHHLTQRSQGLAPLSPDFAQIIHGSEVMQQVLARGMRIAQRSIPVLLEGESGTGKELLARAIHQSSPRRQKPITTVNCGAIPQQLVESVLFGHRKGAFTGAHEDRMGCFEAAHQSTLFLDEIGELPIDAQVKLLRVLQEGEVTRIGAHQPTKVDVRVIAATHRHLPSEVQAGRFREDLFYRLAVAVLRLPPLRERHGDIKLLAEQLLQQINEAALREEPGYQARRLSAGALHLLLRHQWPGNVRELSNTLQRAAIWTEGDVIERHHMQEAIMSIPSSTPETILERPMAPGFSLEDVMAEVASHYITRALQDNPNKTTAATQLGFTNYQRLDAWCRKYQIKGD